MTGRYEQEVASREEYITSKTPAPVELAEMGVQYMVNEDQIIADLEY